LSSQSSARCTRNDTLLQVRLLYAMVCSSKIFGYTASTLASRAVLDGTYTAPKDSDAATKELLAKIAAILKLIPENSVPITITPEQWKQYWKVVNKETLSSESGLHFGHYIVGSKLDIISHYHAAQVTVMLAHAVQLKGGHGDCR
jgi:hypothetical protein